MGDIAAWLQSWWNNLSDGTREQVIGGLIVAFIIGVIAFLRNVLIAAGRRIFRKPVTQSSDQEWRSTPASRDEQQQRRNLSEMRQRVRRFWIDGVLNKSLYKVVRIQLNMAERADAVDNRPWNLVLQQPDEASRMLPPNTRILDVFDQMGQRLLILGEPGSGKTTTLLELARDLLDRADRDPTQLTPIVFNLSSWAERRPPLAEWLIEEALTRHKVDKPITRDWVKGDELILLLDGLDEVQEQHRAACVEAVNTFQQQHIAVPLAICSRTTEYERLTQQLNLSGAVVLQPLTANQIDDYFTQAGESLAALRAAVQQDKDLLDMAESPLLLSIMTLAYQGASPSEVSAIDLTQTRRQHLFDSYLARMFVRREITHLFPPNKTFHWLRWLAQRMMQYGQTTFLIERMQPGWLQPANIRPWRAYTLMALWGPLYGLVCGFILGLTSGAINWLYLALSYTLSTGFILILSGEFINYVVKGGLIQEINIGMSFWVSDGLALGVIFGLIAVLIDMATEGLDKIQIKEQSIPLQRRLKSGLYSFAIYGFAFGIIGTLSYEDMLVGLNLGFIVGMFSGLISVYRPIQMIHKPKGPWSSYKANLKRGAKTGLVIGVIFSVLGLIGIMNGGLTIGVTFGVTMFIVVGLIIEPLPQNKLAPEAMLDVPNKSIRLTSLYGLLSIFVTLLFVTLLFVTLLFVTLLVVVLSILGQVILIDDFSRALVIGLFAAQIAGLFIGLMAGLDNVTKHYLLRLALWIQGSIPRNYVRFLDYAAALIFLRKVGGGYIFVHRLVIEHFARLSDADIQRIVSAIPKQPARKG